MGYARLSQKCPQFHFLGNEKLDAFTRRKIQFKLPTQIHENNVSVKFKKNPILISYFAFTKNPKDWSVEHHHSVPFNETLQ